MAAVDYYLKIDGIKGESKDAKHKGEIDILSWSWGASNAGSYQQGTGLGTGKVSVQDFHFTKRIDKSTPLLMKACATGQHIPKAVLFVRKSGGRPAEYYQLTFSDLLVSSFHGSAHGDVIPTDQISLNFAKIEVRYVQRGTASTAELVPDPPDPAGGDGTGTP